MQTTKVACATDAGGTFVKDDSIRAGSRSQGVGHCPIVRAKNESIIEPYGCPGNHHPRSIPAVRGRNSRWRANSPREPAGQGVPFPEQTLILPSGFPIAGGFREVGRVVRKEAQRLVVAYTFDLRSNILTPETIPNPCAGCEHEFVAWRIPGESPEAVVLRDAGGVAPATGEDHG